MAELLAATLGEEKAAELVNAAAAEVGLGATFGREDALGVLERLADAPGLVGITARFAKSRACLLWR